MVSTFDSSWRECIVSAVEQYGSPLYLFRSDLIDKRLAYVESTFPHFAIRYAVKANPNPWIMRRFRDQLDSLDVSSVGEIKLAMHAGWTPDRIAFTGPGKTPADIGFALNSGVDAIVVESHDELLLVNRLAQSKDMTQRVLLRIMPEQIPNSFAVRLAGRITQFGIDINELPAVLNASQNMSNVSVDGFHIYAGSQCLDASAVGEYFVSTLDLVRDLIDAHCPVTELVIGSGFGIPYHAADESLDLNRVAHQTESAVQSFRDSHPRVKPVLEIGRYLVGEAGVFIVRVVRLKKACEQSIAICDGGMNHNLAACGLLGGIQHRHFKMEAVSTELSDELRDYRIVGPLCTSVDNLALRVKMPMLQKGSVITIGCSGAYGLTASPRDFISHELPKEIVLDQHRFIDISWLKSPVELQ